MFYLYVNEVVATINHHQSLKLIGGMYMEKNLLVIKRKVQATWYRFKPQVFRTATRLSILLLFIMLISQKEISIQLELAPNPENTSKYGSYAQPISHKTAPKVEANLMPLNWWEYLRHRQDDISQNLNLANSATAVGNALTDEQKEQAANYSNLGFVMNQEYAKKHKIDPKIIAFKKHKCASYVETYKSVAIEEAELFGIPAAITLAQGLLESNAGDSRLARNDNNHFGIKCRKKCLGCRCANYTDDSRYDMFRIFKSPWYSFREHSKLLTSRRYKHLLKLPRSDYKNWAHGLQAAGYATDKKYAKKLIKIIESLNLYVYDVE